MNVPVISVVYRWDKLRYVPDKPFLSEVQAVLSGIQRLLTLVLVIGLLVGAVWLMIGGIRYMWDHPPF
jgi:hypothetical protein